MGTKLFLAGGVIAASAIALTSLPAAAHTSVGVQFGVPAPVYVAPPAYQPYQYVQPAAQVWVPAHWAWHDGRQVWVEGHYRPGAGWGMSGNGWRQPVRPWGWRDSDRDGVPNRYDHAPRDPYRY